jgi:topoisomerase-4 subunit A
MDVGHLIRVWTDVGARKPVPLLAKIVDRNENIFTIRYLSESDDKIWRYEDDTYEIDSDSVAEILKTDLEDDLGFQAFDDGFIKVETDDNYVPTDEDEDDDEDEESDLYDSSDEEEEEYESSEPEEDQDEEEEENIDEE